MATTSYSQMESKRGSVGNGTEEKEGRVAMEENIGGTVWTIVAIVKTNEAEDGRDKTANKEMVRKNAIRIKKQKQEKKCKKETRNIIKETEQQEGERSQKLAEKAVTRDILMCNKTLYGGGGCKKWKDKYTGGKRELEMEKQRG